MTTEITTQTAGSGSLATLLVGSHLPLAAPTDITLTARNAQISGYQKSGADLSVRFADGNALQLQNFFVIGEQGDFSRLISASGAPLVTGLMGPEAESETDEPQIAEAAIPSDAIEVFPNAALRSDAQSGAEVTGAATPAPSGKPLIHWPRRRDVRFWYRDLRKRSRRSQELPRATAMVPGDSRKRSRWYRDSRKAIATFRELERAIAMLPRFASAIAMNSQVAKDDCDDSAGPKRDCDDIATRESDRHECRDLQEQSR